MSNPPETYSRLDLETPEGTRNVIFQWPEGPPPAEQNTRHVDYVVYIAHWKRQETWRLSAQVVSSTANRKKIKKNGNVERSPIWGMNQREGSVKVCAACRLAAI